MDGLILPARIAQRREETKHRGVPLRLVVGGIGSWFMVVGHEDVMMRKSDRIYQKSSTTGRAAGTLDQQRRRARAAPVAARPGFVGQSVVD
ncbi:MAG: hypothetical protein CMJ64_12755 [Planctomycetaceae bacterium]|nr:hypothetical protein [Planctomycetaceae bacterium]